MRVSVSLQIVIAPDSFKGSLPAHRVAHAIAAGWSSVRPDDVLTLIPQADGGEGTLDAIEAAIPSAVRRDAGQVTGPDGRPTPGAWLMLPDGTAVVELAQMCGLPLAERLDPLGASTVGLGEVIRHALIAGASRLVIGLGGSASTDGAAGALAALGLRGDASLTAGGGALGELRYLDRSQLIAAPSGGVTLLTDVAAPLLGSTGAAAVFGPQKGATRAQTTVLDTNLARFAALLGGEVSLPGMGAAGGAGYGFVAAWGAQIRPGADYLSALTGAQEAVARADLLITGEGRFDATSRTGKIVGSLIDLAGRHRVPVAIIAGQLAQIPLGSDGRPLRVTSLEDLAGSTDAAMADPVRWLRAAGAAAASAPL
jgi:glycerate kinase